ncbi:unnamed protein product [Acanthosepion pharaonis]|uniref:Uncharacterized protein n=1 Tax=Acanthosepion pharaonis TaxID=158019 RepID=A0A812C5J2_ACAPH|nr:unnamed protein product [Sepia pharaonis]
MSQLYSFKAVEDSFQQPNGNASETTSCPLLFLQGCEDSFQQQIMLQRLHVHLFPRLYSFQNGCEDSFQQQIIMLQTTCPNFSFKAVEDSFQQQMVMLQRRLHVPALFLQGCEDSLSATNNNASERLHVQLYSFKAVEDSFQQPNSNASETTSCQHVPSRL